MHYLLHWPTLAVLNIVLWISAGLIADEPADSVQSIRIECLIELLASKNQAPRVHGSANRGEDQTISFPKGFDESLQVTVYLAVKELLAEDEVVIDLLLSHQGDGRYSFSVNSDTDYNINVSQACEWIARARLLAYEPELHVITGSQFGIYPAEHNVPFRTWWEKNKQRGLATLQIEAIDATLKFMENVDGRTAIPWHPLASRLPLEEFNRHRDANLQTLKAIRQYIATSGTAYPAKTLDDSHRCMFGLPWGGRRHNK